MYYLGIVKDTVPGVSGANGTDAALPAGSRMPETIDAAADLIINEMPLRDRVLLSNFTDSELGGLAAHLRPPTSGKSWPPGPSTKTDNRVEHRIEPARIE